MKSGLKSIGLFALLMIFIIVGKSYFMAPKYNSGENIPNFTAKLKNGQDFNLAETQGSMVLLSFWGSWCGPCRAKSPALVALYNKYHGKEFKNFMDFEIISVSIEKDEKRWAHAIEKNNLHWSYHILDKTTSYKLFNGEIAKKFGVKSVPANYLLDAKGQIVGVDLSAAALDELLNKELK